MKKFTTILILILLVYCSFSGFSQQRLKKWFISPNQIDVTSIPILSGIAGATASTTQLCNGIYNYYNLNGPPMFYIADDPTVIFPFVGLNVYDRNNNVMGTLQGFVTDRTSELSIVPFPDNDGCSINKYYIFYSSPNPLNLSAELRDYIVDMNGNGNLGTMSGPNTVLSIPTSEWAGIAVGQQSNGIRFLYFSGGSVFGTRNIEKVTIAASGLTHQNIFTDNSHFWDFETSVSVRPSTYCLIIFHDVNS